MSGFKGTPGPWAFERDDASRDEGAIRGGGGVLVCWFGDSESHYNTSGFAPEADDLSLILAAPELLEALQDILHAYDKHDEHSEFDFARAAIAKALGESQ